MCSRGRPLGTLLALVTLLVGCDRGRRVEQAPGASAILSTPPEAASAIAKPAPGQPLPLGKESMFASINEGDLPTADGILNDVWPARGFPPAKLPSSLTWTEDPYKDAFWRFMFYGLQYTSHLLWAYFATGDDRYQGKLVAILRSFVVYDETRPWNRQTFDNPHQSAYRAMVLVNTYFKLKKTGHLPGDLDRPIRDAVERLGAYLTDGRHAPDQASGSFESKVNHGFNEAAALLLIADNYPEMKNAASWRALAVERLEVMRSTNIDADGVDVENSPFYHMYVLGIVGAIATWAKDHEPSVSPAYTTTRNAMLHYAAYIAQPDGKLPMLGATATTNVPDMDHAVFEPVAALDENFAFVYTRGKQGKMPAPGVELFPTAGLFVLRAKTPAAEVRNQTFVTFDAGKYRTEHSHLDALSITLFSSGREILPDSGLMTYDHGTDFDYFHGTRAHNTVVVDGVDQQASDATPLRSGTSGDCAWASGRSGLYPGVDHVRTVALLRQDLVLVTDTLASASPHSYVQTWHLLPAAQAPTATALNVVVSDEKGPVLAIRQGETAGVTVEVKHGATSPMQGWYSTAYGKKTATYALEYTARQASARFVTLFMSGSYASSTSPPAIRERGNVIRVCDGSTSYTLTLDATGAAGGEGALVIGGGCVQ
jgi:hypothetical protein